MVADLDYLEGKADRKAEIITCIEKHLRKSPTDAIGVSRWSFAPPFLFVKTTPQAGRPMENWKRNCEPRILRMGNSGYLRSGRGEVLSELDSTGP